MFRIDLNKNPTVKKKLTSLLGEKFDLSKLAVFEGLANDTLPINKQGSVYNQARMTNNYLSNMADKVGSGEYVPIIEQHDQGGKLPIGRIFDAKTYPNLDNNTDSDLHILFYVDETSEPNLVSKLSNGSVSEISTGTVPSSLQCSACGYDFLAGDDNRRRLYAGKNYTPLCSEGHQWGVGGNHLKLGNLGSWKETSLVTRGAATRAHILSEKELRLSHDSGEISLAANADDDKLLLVTLQDAGSNFPTNDGKEPLNPTDGKNPMSEIQVPLSDYNKLILAQGKSDELTLSLTEANKVKEEALAAKLTAETEKAEALTQKEEVEAKLNEAEAKVTELEAKLAAALKPGGNSKPVENTPNGGEQEQSANFCLGNEYFKSTL